MTMQSIVIDGRTFEVAPGSPSGPLHARVDGEDVVLPFWSWGDHRDALRRHLRVQGDRLVLDEDGYAGELLQRGHVDSRRRAELVPLVLWWTTGAGRRWRDAGGIELDPEGWIELSGGYRARVRGWTWRERRLVLGECVQDDGVESLVDPIAVVERMLASNLLELRDPAGAETTNLDELDASTVHELLDVLTGLSMPSLPESTAALLADPRAARMLQRLCAVLGWTPSKVLEAPAAEIDLVLATLRAEPTTSPTTAPERRSGLREHPDATVLVFGPEVAS
ncbi:MAG: hypothetical protein AB1Z98_17810 [Nannocystaceae bacterium]